MLPLEKLFTQIQYRISGACRRRAVRAVADLPLLEPTSTHLFWMADKVSLMLVTSPQRYVENWPRLVFYRSIVPRHPCAYDRRLNVKPVHAERSASPDKTLRKFTQGSGDSSVVRAPDSWPKSFGFESRREQRENFLLQGQLSMLTLIPVSVPTVLPQ